MHRTPRWAVALMFMGLATALAASTVIADSHEDDAGKNLVLWFYPKADTPD